MGDSYSAGVGTYDYDLNLGCYRSSDSYPLYLKDELGLDLMSFIACEGAMTSDIFANQGSNAPQLDALTPDVGLVTLSIGGNDLGFVEVLTRCVTNPSNSGVGHGCALDAGLNTSIDGRLESLAGEEGATATAPGGA